MDFSMLPLRVEMVATRRAQEVMQGKSRQIRLPRSGKAEVWCSIAFRTFDNFNPRILSTECVLLDLALNEVIVDRDICML